MKSFRLYKDKSLKDFLNLPVSSKILYILLAPMPLVSGMFFGFVGLLLFKLLGALIGFILGFVFGAGIIDNLLNPPISSKCPSCGGYISFKASGFGFKAGIDCPACKQRLVIRNKQALTPEQAKRINP